MLLKFLKDEVKVSIKIKFLATSFSAPYSSPLSTFGCFIMAQASVLPQNIYLNCAQQKFNSHTYKHYFIRHKAKCDVQRLRYLPSWINITDFVCWETIQTGMRNKKHDTIDLFLGILIKGSSNHSDITE